MAAGSTRLTNYQVAAFALWAAGGATRRVDTEDVAVVCWRYAPSRFSWKKYPDYPDKEVVRFALADAKKSKNGAIVAGDATEGWRLTPMGIRWVKNNDTWLREFETRPGRSRLSAEDDASLRKVRSHSLFEAWGRGETRPSRYDIADVADVTADAPLKTVVDRLSELENLAIVAADDEMRRFVQWLRVQLRS